MKNKVIEILKEFEVFECSYSPESMKYMRAELADRINAEYSIGVSEYPIALITPSKQRFHQWVHDFGIHGQEYVMVSRVDDVRGRYFSATQPGLMSWQVDSDVVDNARDRIRSHPTPEISDEETVEQAASNCRWKPLSQSVTVAKRVCENETPIDEFRKHIANELTRDELIDRLCETTQIYRDLREQYLERPSQSTPESTHITEGEIEKIITDHQYGDGVDAKSAAKKITGKWGMGVHGREVWHIDKDDPRISNSENAYDKWAIDYFLQKYEKEESENVTQIARDAWGAALSWALSKGLKPVSEEPKNRICDRPVEDPNNPQWDADW